MNIQKILEKWQQAGLLETRQVEAILQYEATKTTAEKSNFALYGFVSLGVSIVVLGIISIIAAHWAGISPIIKLITYFILQAGLGFAYLKVPVTRDLLKETLLYLFALWFFAGIALVAQIFQLSGDLWKSFAFWLLLNSGTVFIAEKRLLAHLWWIVFFITIINNEFISSSLELLSATFLVVALGLKGTKLLTRLSSPFIELALKYGFFALLMFASSHGTALWITAKFGIKTWPVLRNSFEIILMYSAAFLAFISAYNRLPALSVNLKKTIAGMFIIICLFNTIPFYFPQISGSVGAALGFILLWFYVAWACVLLPSRHLYNLATLIIMFRFIAVYVEIFGSLLATGVGLLVSGLVLLLAAFVWHRYRQLLLKWMQ